MSLQKKAKKLENKQLAEDKKLDGSNYTNDSNTEFGDRDRGGYFNLKKGKEAAQLALGTNDKKAPSSNASNSDYAKMKKDSPLADRLNTIKGMIGNKDSSDYHNLKAEDDLSSSRRNRFHKLKAKMKK